MPAPVEPFVVITSGQVIAFAVMLGAGASGIVAAVMKWSFSRNVKLLDDAISGLRDDFKKMGDKQHAGYAEGRMYCVSAGVSDKDC